MVPIYIAISTFFLGLIIGYFINFAKQKTLSNEIEKNRRKYEEAIDRANLQKINLKTVNAEQSEEIVELLDKKYKLEEMVVENNAALTKTKNQLKAKNQQLEELKTQLKV